MTHVDKLSDQSKHEADVKENYEELYRVLYWFYDNNVESPVTFEQQEEVKALDWRCEGP